jgi:hypothetical protein
VELIHGLGKIDAIGFERLALDHNVDPPNAACPIQALEVSDPAHADRASTIIEHGGLRLN